MTEQQKESLIKAAHAGGKLLKQYFNKTLNPKEKTTPADMQTEADVESEKAILEILKKEFPEYNINSEESGNLNKNSEYTFYVDPLDGTNNFVMGIPNFAVSIGLAKNNQLVAGVVYQPILDQTYYAEAGKGAFLDRNLIKVSTNTKISNLTIAVSFPYVTDKNKANSLKNTLALINPKRVVIQWSIANDLCLLANGRIDCMINDSGEVHDFAAGKLIALEAGAKIISFDGVADTATTKNKFIISNSDLVNKQIFEKIKNFLAKKE